MLRESNYHLELSSHFFKNESDMKTNFILYKQKLRTCIQTYIAKGTSKQCTLELWKMILKGRYKMQAWWSKTIETCS